MYLLYRTIILLLYYLYDKVKQKNRGLIINWFSTTTEQYGGTQFTFATPFSSATSYGIALCGTNAYQYYPNSAAKTSTSIIIDANAKGLRTFIAIGY